MEFVHEAIFVFFTAEDLPVFVQFVHLFQNSVNSFSPNPYSNSVGTSLKSQRPLDLQLNNPLGNIK